MEKATVIEMVLFKVKEGIEIELAQKELSKVNDFLSEQEGFISRKISISDDGQFLDIVFWEDMNTAMAAANKIMQSPDAMKIFSIIDQKTQLFKHFKVFNDTEQ